MIRLYHIVILAAFMAGCSGRSRDTGQMVSEPDTKIPGPEAMAVYVSELISEDPGNPDLYLKMAEISLDRDMISEAESAITSYEDLNGSAPEADFLKARINFKMERYSEALEIAEKLFLNGYESIELHVLLYHLYLEAGDNLKAIDQINYAIEKNPANDEYFYYKSICYLHNRDTLNALVSLETAINDGYRALDAIVQYVDLLVEVDERDKAFEAIGLGLSIDEDNPDLNTAHARLLTNQGDYKQAKSILFAILQEEPGQYKALTALSELYLDTHAYDSVIYYSNRAIHQNANYFPPYYTKAAVYERRKNYYAAVDVYSQVLEIDPENPVALYESERIRNYLSYLQKITEEYNNRPVVPVIKPKTIEN